MSEKLPATSASVGAIASAREAFDLWAPLDAPWSAWAKPVLFAQPPIASRPPGQVPVKWQEIDVASMVAGSERTAVVVDLPGIRSVEVGMAFAARGFRPVPLYNGVDGALAPGSIGPVVDTAMLADALYAVASELAHLPVPHDAPPVFLIDANRKASSVFPSPGRFDNRWVVFPQDFPSARLLKERGIRRALLVSQAAAVATDLAHVLLRWQLDGVPVHASDEVLSPPRPIEITKPHGFRALGERVMIALGLSRNSAGGFGSVVPHPTQSSG